MDSCHINGNFVDNEAGKDVVDEQLDTHEEKNEWKLTTPVETK